MPSQQIYGLVSLTLHVGLNLQNLVVLLKMLPVLREFDALLRLRRPRACKGEIKLEDVSAQPIAESDGFNYSEFCILHSSLRTLKLTSDRNEKAPDQMFFDDRPVMERLVISHLSASLTKLFLHNFKSLKNLDIYAPQIQKVKLIDCF